MYKLDADGHTGKRFQFSQDADAQMQELEQARRHVWKTKHDLGVSQKQAAFLTKQTESKRRLDCEALNARLALEELDLRERNAKRARMDLPELTKTAPRKLTDAAELAELSKPVEPMYAEPSYQIRLGALE